MEQKHRKALMWGIPLLLLAAIAIFLLIRSMNAGPVTNNPTDFEFEAEQTRQTESAGVTPGIEIPGYSVIPVAADTTDVEIDLYNPEANDVYFQISFLLKDSGELLYESKLIEPGQHLYNITLTKPLSPGDYAITIQYATFSTDGSFSPRNGANVDCVIQAGK